MLMPLCSGVASPCSAQLEQTMWTLPPSPSTRAPLATGTLTDPLPRLSPASCRSLFWLQGSHLRQERLASTLSTAAAGLDVAIGHEQTFCLLSLMAAAPCLSLGPALDDRRRCLARSWLDPVDDRRNILNLWSK